MARRWYRGSLRARARRATQSEWGARARPRAVQLGLAFVLAETVEEAAKNCAWTRDFCFNDEEVSVLSSVTSLLMRRSESFVVEICRLASQFTPRLRAMVAAAQKDRGLLLEIPHAGVSLDRLVTAASL